MRGLPAGASESLCRKILKEEIPELDSAQYRTGMTVQEYIHACDASGVPNHALFDITWDSDPKRRFIELYD